MNSFVKNDMSYIAPRKLVFLDLISFFFFFKSSLLDPDTKIVFNINDIYTLDIFVFTSVTKKFSKFFKRTNQILFNHVIAHASCFYQQKKRFFLIFRHYNSIFYAFFHCFFPVILIASR